MVYGQQGSTRKYKEGIKRNQRQNISFKDTLPSDLLPPTGPDLLKFLPLLKIIAH